MKKILLLGPLPDPITGLSIANKTVMDNIGKHHNYKTDYINTSYHCLEGLGSFSFAKLFFYSKQYLKLYKIFKNHDIYITPGQTFFGVVKYAPFIYLAKLCKKQIIIHIHGNYLHQEYKQVANWKKKIMHSILSKADKGIVLSDLLRNNLSPFLDDGKIHILYNFAEDMLFPQENKEVTLHTDHLRILYLSNLMPEKGIFDFLDALLILQKKNIEFTAQIAGAIDPSHKERIEKYFSQLSSNVEYLGIISGEDKRNAFLKSNIFILPTYYPTEGQPISILEAMATGNVILTTKHAGIPDIFEDSKNGYYIEKKLPKNISIKLIELSTQRPENEKIMKHNQQIAKEKYTVSSFINNLINIIKK